LFEQGIWGYLMDHAVYIHSVAKQGFQGGAMAWDQYPYQYTLGCALHQNKLEPVAQFVSSQPLFSYHHGSQDAPKFLERAVGLAKLL
jgi:hypothetical protein